MISSIITTTTKPFRLIPTAPDAGAHLRAGVRAMPASSSDRMRSRIGRARARIAVQRAHSYTSSPHPVFFDVGPARASGSVFC
jgi:hypothetical protein